MVLPDAFYERDANGAVWLVGSLRDISATKPLRTCLTAAKKATLEILSHDLSGAFIMVQQIAEFLREEVQAPANPEVTTMLRALEAATA